MADICDNADLVIEQALRHQMILALKGSGPVIAARGFCLHCESKELPDGLPLPADRRWCCVECRDAHERALRAR